jgi:hypothetical protein
LNKASLLEKLRNTLQERVGGTIRIGALDLSFFRHFPMVTARLSDVSLRDSAWERHHHDLLKAAAVYVSCNWFRSVVNSRLELGEIDLEHGVIYFFTDSTGYSNTSMFRPRRTGRTGEAPKPPDIRLTDVRWIMDRQDKQKLFDLDIHHLHCGIGKEDRLLHLRIGAGMQVNSFAFNTDKGSYLRGKRLSGNFAVDYNTASRIIQFHEAKVAIDDHPFVFSGRFFPTVVPDPFFLQINTKDIAYRQVTALLTPQLQQKLDRYDIDKPVSIQAQLDAGVADDPTPQIQVRLDLSGGSVLTPAGRFTDVIFRGSFTNEWRHGQRRGDENSALRFLGFSGKLQNLPLRADTAMITNLHHPQLSCDLHSRFQLGDLNDITGSETLRFTGGVGTMDLRYQGPLSEDDTSAAAVNGHLDLDTAEILYLPYRLRLTNGKGRLLFRDQDLFIDQFKVHAGSTEIRAKGTARNLVALLDQNAQNVSIGLDLASPHLDVEDFTAIAGSPSKTAPGRSNKTLFGETFARVDRLLKEGSIHVAIEAPDLRYKKFAGAHARADLQFADHQIRLNRLTISQETGSIELKATLTRKNADGHNPISLESHLQDVDLPGLFTAFNDFGQNALSARNLRGRLNADVHLRGAMNDKARIVRNSLKGSVDFTVSDGQLVDFEPMEKIRSTVLKNRDLSDVRFAELRNHLDVDSTTLIFRRMEIRSTAFTLFMEGSYDLSRGPDMDLQIPLSNLKKKPDQNAPPENKGNDGKAGLSVRLRARRGEDGQLKITWDPFKKALKKIR